MGQSMADINGVAKGGPFDPSLNQSDSPVCRTRPALWHPQNVFPEFNDPDELPRRMSDCLSFLSLRQSLSDGPTRSVSIRMLYFEIILLFGHQCATPPRSYVARSLCNRPFVLRLPSYAVGLPSGAFALLAKRHRVPAIGIRFPHFLESEDQAQWTSLLDRSFQDGKPPYVHLSTMHEAVWGKGIVAVECESFPVVAVLPAS